MPRFYRRGWFLLVNNGERRRVTGAAASTCRHGDALNRATYRADEGGGGGGVRSQQPGERRLVPARKPRGVTVEPSTGFSAGLVPGFHRLPLSQISQISPPCCHTESQRR